LRELQARHRLVYLFISHDLRVIRALASEVIVMKDGQVVEAGPAARIFEAPQHPYTRALIASVPRMSGPVGRLATIEGQPPSLIDLPVGCRFAARCAHVEPRCIDAYPSTVRVGDDHTADCWKVAPA